MAWEHIKENIV